MAMGDMVTERGGYAWQRGYGLRTLTRRMAGWLLLFVIGCTPPTLVAADAVDIAATVGFSETFQPGHWTPLTVTVTNRGGELSGELEVEVSGDDASRNRLLVTYHRRTLELHGNARKNLQFTVLPQGLFHPLVIRVRSGGREIARTEVDLHTRFAAQRLLLVLSRNADLDYLNDSAVDGLRVLYPHPELLPAHWRGYDAVAAIVLHGVSLERLTASQFEALHKWIAQGGTLAVSGGADYGLLRSARLAELLPAAPLGMTRMDARELQGAFSASLDVAQPVHVNRLGNVRGEVRLRAGEVPLIVERSLGLGRVVYLAFDVAAYPFDRWDGMRALWLRTLRLSAPASATSASMAKPVVGNALAALIRAEATPFPRYATAFLFLVLYLGLIFVGCGLPVRHSWQRWQATLWSWGPPLVFAPAAWLMFGPATFPRGATATTVALIEPLPNSNYARLDVELGIHANRTGPVRFEYQGADPVLYPHRQAQKERRVEDWIFGEGASRFVEPLDHRRYVLHALEGEDVVPFHLEAAIRTEGPAAHLDLNNASAHSLEALWLVFAGYAYELGSVPAGARLERRLVPRENGIEVQEASWRRLPLLSQGLPSHVLGPAQILLERKSQQMGESGFPRPGHALLIGYTTCPLQPAGASADWPRRERAVVAFQFAATAQDSAPGGNARDRDRPPGSDPRSP